jgi:predicted Fe-Mo cluster-binding NifX family protein
MFAARATAGSHDATRRRPTIEELRLGETPMNICIPVNEDKGFDSQVCAHFGAAPAFMIVDSETGACRAIHNGNQHHAHGGCAPLKSLAGEQIDCMVVGGIGGGALGKLNAANIQVFVSEQATVAETVAAYKAGTLRLVQPHMACAGHGHDHR